MFHRHKWGVTSALNALRGSSLFPNGIGSEVTVLLLKCRECSDLKTKELDGHWADTLAPPAERSTT